MIFKLSLFVVVSSVGIKRIDCISEDTQDTPQSGSTTFRRHQKKDRQGTNNDKTNVYLC